MKETQEIYDNAAHQTRAAQQANDRVMGLDSDNCNKRQTLQDRVRHQLADAEHIAQKTNRLAELKYLLDKNPEVARILDLIEEVR